MCDTFDQQKAGRIPQLKKTGQFRIRDRVGDGEKSWPLTFTLTHGKSMTSEERLFKIEFYLKGLNSNVISNLQRLNAYLAFSGGVHSS